MYRDALHWLFKNSMSKLLKKIVILVPKLVFESQNIDFYVSAVNCSNL